ncbi:hypothetical protein TUM19329_19550 [Legionella antarctica]|uniref:F-box domain-containing protein n=1 Tax=Legionella antarctica TaxID=2708020 RepID=A0A6F8T4I4_9GAMM|nr:F-box protein [Legionella antarctica]BCA95594.1 hypothetical protein TUM19329_19550 [Legionella antarctica]
MNDKLDILGQLPQDIKFATAYYLPTSDLINLSTISRKHWNLFKPMLDVRRFLFHVVHGEYHAVVGMLKIDIHLIFKKGQISDCSGRIFESISGFEYSLWALDKYMWEMMLDCVHQDEEGKKILTTLRSQHHQVKTKGITYCFNGNKFTENHFDFENTIINELQTQYDYLSQSDIKDDPKISKQWREGVGGAQKLFPMHVVYEYCSDDPTRAINSWPKPSTQFYNWGAKNKENWFAIDSKLGIEFAIYKGMERAGAFNSILLGKDGCLVDLNAMKTLYQLRTKEFIDLKSQFKDLSMSEVNVSQIATGCK